MTGSSDENDYIAYEGCGGYLLDQKLRNIWALEEMAGEEVSAEDFNQGVPALELYAAEGRMT